MHLQVIICFALLIWWPDPPPVEPIVESPAWTGLIVAAYLASLSLGAVGISTRALRRLSRPGGGERAQHLYHRGTTVLRLTAVSAYAAILFLTRWVEIIRSSPWLSPVPGLVDLTVVLPFLAGATLIFAGTYPIDRALHGMILRSRAWEGARARKVWSFRQYLLFNTRHHLLVVVVPMILILAAFDLARDHREVLARVFRVQWAAEAVPAVAAGAVFVIAPVMLRYIWPTRPLPPGALRTALEGICARIGLRCRDILVWQSGGMMVNAAVMGLFPRVRYVLLSDGLLETMTPNQVEAVFGHEAGHIRLRHIHYFLLFAICTMLILSGVVEGLRLGVEHGLFELDVVAIEGIGLGVILLIWGGAFGWLSRRFERQADLFGARCVTPTDPRACHLPCSVHDCAGGGRPDGAVCATAAATFTSALDRVAVLNGIPHEERSWRHSSIASRMRFLVSLAGDPLRLRSFERLIRRAKTALVVGAVVGCLLAGLYVWHHPLYGIGVGVDGTETGTAAHPILRSGSVDRHDARTHHRWQGPGSQHPSENRRAGR